MGAASRTHVSVFLELGHDRVVLEIIVAALIRAKSGGSALILFLFSVTNAKYFYIFTLFLSSTLIPECRPKQLSSLYLVSDSSGYYAVGSRSSGKEKKTSIC
jgi:hypothetical protein